MMSSTNRRLSMASCAPMVLLNIIILHPFFSTGAVIPATIKRRTSLDSRDSIIAPTVVSTSIHGPTTNRPTSQFINQTSPPDPTLDPSMLLNQYDARISEDYPISQDTGILDLNGTTQPLLAKLSDVPHLSRDGGKGGVLAGQHIFLFCDTGSYKSTTNGSNGEFEGFVSSSVATDVGMQGLFGKPLNLQDGIGQWSDDVGRMRGFAPMTQGEQEYNANMQGTKGKRYAIWPESSIIPLYDNSGIVVAPLVYDSVDLATRQADFLITGNTLLTITAGGPGGPVAERTVARFFNMTDVQYGSKGGIRSWGPTGIGGNDGRVYIFGSTRGGLLVGRTDTYKAADKNSYEFWDGSSWTPHMQGSDSRAFFVEGAFQDVDVFYSPRHKTFIIVYMTIYADNTLYYRYLNADSPILPPYDGGDSNSDYVENIVKYPWSDEQVLFKAPPPKTPDRPYVYSGGVHRGYFQEDDITQGGSKMLLSWTSPTGQNPAAPQSEYQIVTGEVTWA